METAGVGSLVAFALVVRCLRWWQTSLLFNDGPTFLWIAQEMAAARWREALAHPYHPLYPFATLIAHFAIPGWDWERAAVAVSIGAGAAAVLLLFVFLRSAFGRREAWLGALVLAVQPRIVAFSDVQSDALYLALFVASAAALWVALRNASAAMAGWSGALTGLAYLVRPEGLELAVVASVAAGLAVLRGQLGSAGRAAGWLAAFAAGLLIVMLPYVTAMRIDSGVWRLTGKKPVTGLLDVTTPGPAASAQADGLPPPAVAPPPASSGAPQTSQGVVQRPADPSPEAARPLLLRALSRLVAAASSGLRPWLLALIAVGAFARRGRPSRAGELVLIFVCVDAIVGVLQFRFSGYLDMRHVLPPLVLTFGYVAPGIDALAGVIARLVRRIAAPGVGAPPAWLTASLVGVALVAGVGQALRPEKDEARAERAAAEWLREYAVGEGAVAAPKTRLGYYAHRPSVSLHNAPRSGVVGWLGANGVRWVILDDDDDARFPALREAPLALLHCAQAGRRWAAVYAVAGEGVPPAIPEASGCSAAAQRSLAGDRVAAPEVR